MLRRAGRWAECLQLVLPLQSSHNPSYGMKPRLRELQEHASVTQPQVTGVWFHSHTPGHSAAWLPVTPGCHVIRCTRIKTFGVPPASRGLGSGWRAGLGPGQAQAAEMRTPEAENAEGEEERVSRMKRTARIWEGWESWEVSNSHGSLAWNTEYPTIG